MIFFNWILKIKFKKNERMLKLMFVNIWWEQSFKVFFKKR